VSAEPFDQPIWSLEMVLAWLATGDRSAVDLAARHVERGGRASSTNLLLAIRAGLAETGAKKPKSAFRKRSTAEHWYTAALAALVEAGRAGKLGNAVTVLPDGGKPRTDFNQWAKAELRFASRRHAAGASCQARTWTQFEFDSARIRSLWPGKRGPKHTFVRARAGADIPARGWRSRRARQSISIGSFDASSVACSSATIAKAFLAITMREHCVGRWRRWIASGSATPHQRTINEATLPRA
jgi:hypothetical protein